MKHHCLRDFPLNSAQSPSKHPASPQSTRSGERTMDNSISDILASVTRAAYATSTSLLGHTDHPSAPTIPPAQLDLQLLTRAWVSERSAPELLPYPTDLVERVMARIREQVRNQPTATKGKKPGKLTRKANGRGHGNHSRSRR